MKAKVNSLCSKNMKTFICLFIHLFISSTNIYWMPTNFYPFLLEQERKWIGGGKGKGENLADLQVTEGGLEASGVHWTWEWCLPGGFKASLSKQSDQMPELYVCASYRLPGFRGKSPLLTGRDEAGALHSEVMGGMPPHLHQPSHFLALSSIPMGSSEFPHVLGQEGQRGHICVCRGVGLISASCWILFGPGCHILFHISYCNKTTDPSLLIRASF